MSELNDNEESLWTSSWEEETYQQLNGEDHEQILRQQMNDSNEKLFTVFQNAAHCVAVMYKGTTDGQQSLWIPFQTAAGHITSLYKDSVEMIRRNAESGIQLGEQRRTRELLTWIRRSRRNNIRREELIAFLAGKVPPPARCSTHLRSSPRTRITLDRISSPRLTSPLNPFGPESDLSPFRDAFSLAANSPNPFSGRPPPVGSPNGSSNLSFRRRSSPYHLSAADQMFPLDESVRTKRPAPPASPSHDVNMDSPQHKRSRFT